MAEKKLTDICDIQYGYPFDSSGFSSSAEDGMPLIRIRDVKDGHSETYFKGDFPEEYIIHKGDYLVGMDGEFNIAAWQSDDALLNQRVCRIASKCHNVSTHYLYRFLTKELKRIEDETPFVTVKHLSAKRLNQVYLNVPSLPEQERIVAELDLLTGIIDKQKAQLKELDTLAQSIFYDMFGDPIENVKGWDISKLEDVSTLINGRAYKQDELLSEGKYKVLRVGNFFTNDNYYYSNLELEEEKYCYCGDLLFAWSASFGAFIWTENKTIFHYHIWRILYDKEKLNIHYYRFLLNAMTSYFMKDVHGIGMVHLTKAGMEQYDLPIPPLRLQQSFAQKIQSIESQKASINRSIEETQKLFDYTMDKYFG